VSALSARATFVARSLPREDEATEPQHDSRYELRALLARLDEAARAADAAILRARVQAALTSPPVPKVLRGPAPLRGSEGAKIGQREAGGSGHHFHRASVE